MTISDIFRLESFPVDPMDRVGLVRHTGTELGDYLLDSETFEFYQSVQEEGKFDRVDYLLSFLVSKDGKTTFRGVYKLVGKELLATKHFDHIYLDGNNRRLYESLCGKYCFYRLEKTEYLSEYEMRLVVDWGASKLSWFQYHDDERSKAITEILPRGYFGHFTDYLSISFTRPELEFLFANKESNPLWQSQLSKVGGIYLIQDERDGQQYVGSATGKNGIWARWETYFKDPSGGNKLLAERLADDKSAFKTFRYSILEVFPGNVLKEEILFKESLYKKKLGTRAFGLNDN